MGRYILMTLHVSICVFSLNSIVIYALYFLLIFWNAFEMNDWEMTVGKPGSKDEHHLWFIHSISAFCIQFVLLSLAFRVSIQVNLDMTDSMGPGKLVRHMQNLSYTYNEYLICIGLGPSISSDICKNMSYSGPSYPSSPVVSMIALKIYHQTQAIFQHFEQNLKVHDKRIVPNCLIQYTRQSYIVSQPVVKPQSCLSRWSENSHMVARKLTYHYITKYCYSTNVYHHIRNQQISISSLGMTF